MEALILKLFFAVAAEKKIEAAQEIFHDNHKLSNQYVFIVPSKCLSTHR